MKKIVSLLFILFVAVQYQAQTTVEMVTHKNIDTSIKAVSFNELEELYYASEHPSLKITFDTLHDYQIHFDGKNTGLISNRDIYLKNLERGDHTITLKKKGAKPISKSIKIKPSPPWFSNDATVLGILMIVLFLVFKTAKSERSYFKKFYKIVPALLLCYFIPAGLNSLGIISSQESNLYHISSRYLLPASLVLLCLSIDIPAIKRLGSKAVIMFLISSLS